MILDELEQYEIQGRMPSSPFGERFEAADRVHGRTVLLTRLPAKLATQPLFETRLLQVTQQVAPLRYDGLQRIHGPLRDGETLYLVGERVAGRPLAGLRGQTLPVATALLLVAQIAEALDALHQAETVHGALNPGAVFVTRAPVARVMPDGADAQNGAGELRVTLADLGLPSLSAREMAAVQGLAPALVPYLAPEQAVKGQAAPASDIFSLGVILYELITGRLPFNPQQLSQGFGAYYRQKVRPAGKLRPELPPAIEALIHKAIALRPPDRFRNAAQMARVLRTAGGEIAAETAAQQWTNGAAAAVSNRIEQEPSLPSSPFAVSVEPKIVEITAGKQVVVNVTIRNKGNDVDHATLQVEGLQRQWVSMAQEFVRLVPGSEASLPVTITVPRNSSATAGRLPFLIKVASTAHDDFRASVSGTIVIHPFSQMRADVAPLFLEHESRLTVTVRNEGNVTETFQVEGGNVDNSVQVNGEENRLRLLAGATGTVSLKVTAVSQPTFGDAHTLPFSVRVWANSGVESEHSGQLEVPPAIPRWLVTVLAALLLLATTAGVIKAISSFEEPAPAAVAVATATEIPATRPAATEAAGPQAESVERVATEPIAVDEEPEMPEPRATTEAASVAETAEGEPDGASALEESPTAQAGEDNVDNTLAATVAVPPSEEEGGAGQEMVPYIAYQLGEGAGSQIRLVASDGTGDQLLVESAAQPAWAPDGRRLAFVRSHYEGEGADRIYSGDSLNVVTVSGSLLAPLSEGVQQIGGLSWSPDGQHVAYHAVPAESGSGSAQLFIANSDGSGTQQITGGEGAEGGSSSWPVWSPDGSQLLFYRQQPPEAGAVEPRGALYLIGAGGGSMRPLLDNHALSVAETGHSWSPDGSSILFAASDGHELRYFTVRADGSELVQIPGIAEDGAVARWSPDGTRILYLVQGTDGQTALFTGTLDGRESEQLTEGVPVVEARWSAGGSRIALSADRDGDGSWELYQIPAQRPASSALPWQPLPAQVGAITLLEWQPQSQ